MIVISGMLEMSLLRIYLFAEYWKVDGLKQSVLKMILFSGMLEMSYSGSICWGSLVLATICAEDDKVLWDIGHVCSGSIW
jgi:hypothetical protein